MHSNETKEKIRLSTLGKTKTENHKLNISRSKSGNKHPRWGHTLSSECKEKIRNGNILSKQRVYVLRNETKEYELSSRGLHEFCNAYKLSWYSILKTKTTQQAYCGWILTQTTKE